VAARCQSVVRSGATSYGCSAVRRPGRSRRVCSRTRRYGGLVTSGRFVAKSTRYSAPKARLHQGREQTGCSVVSCSRLVVILDMRWFMPVHMRRCDTAKRSWPLRAVCAHLAGKLLGAVLLLRPRPAKTEPAGHAVTNRESTRFDYSRRRCSQQPAQRDLLFENPGLQKLLPPLKIARTSLAR
jgi:hypothetical protein